MMVELPGIPDPFDFCYEWDGPHGTRKFSTAWHNGRPPDRSVSLFREEQLRECAAAAVAAERVRCGEVVRRQAVHFPASICRMIAEAVEED